jgi:5-methylthioadenosine/S-adenosylhomocysteine deaminase
MVDGKFLMEERKLLTMDVGKVCKEAETRAKRISAELNG